MSRLGRTALGAAALALGCARTPPPARDEIRFAHGPHLAQGIQCTGCHGVIEAPRVETVRPAAGPADAAPASALAMTPLPGQARCLECHTAPEEQRCSFCHTHPEVASTYAAEGHGIHFDHTNHAGRGVIGCVRCHGYGVSDDSVAEFEPVIPPMAACTDSCHAADMPTLTCSRCHEGLHRYARASLELVRHPPGFMRQHGARARLSDSLCGQCHEPTFCADCHRASPGLPLELVASMNVTREFVHAGDFRARHPSEARLEPASCLRCHGVSFCDDCHHESGVGGSVGHGGPHPPGWLDPLSPNGHARAARQDILTCAGCHEADAETTCVPCHRVGSIAGNPHPSGFAPGLDPERHGICRVCHAEGP